MSDARATATLPPVATAEPTERPLGQVAADICQLAGQLAAATCSWLELIAEFDRREGYAEWGMTTAAQWLSWRCALSPGAAREHVRVARALPTLPILRAEFAAGRLSYSQARAITRVTARHPAIEAELVEHARHMSAAQLEDLCRGIHAGDDADPPPRRASRYLRRHYDDDGWLVLRARIPPEEAALIETALDAWQTTHQYDQHDPDSDLGAADAEGPTGQVPAGTSPRDSADSSSDDQCTDGTPPTPEELDQAVAEDADPDATSSRERDAADGLVAMAEALLAHGVPRQSRRPISGDHPSRRRHLA